MPLASCSSDSSSRIWACTVTSRAVVGSSAMSRSGSPAKAMAIITRWAMPPDSWCGYSLTRRAGSEIPTRSSSSTARRRRAARSMAAPDLSACPIWRPTDITGSSDARGCWKIMATLAPRTEFSTRSGAPASSMPSKRTDPSTIRPGGSTSPAIGQRRHRLAAARLPHQSQDLAPPHLEAHAVHRLDHAGFDEEVGAEALDAQQRLGHADGPVERERGFQ